MKIWTSPDHLHRAIMLTNASVALSSGSVNSHKVIASWQSINGQIPAKNCIMYNKRFVDF